MQADSVKILKGARDHAEMGLIPAGMYKNKKYVGDQVEVSSTVETVIEDLLHDPQTSGGLLISLPADQAEILMEIYKDSLKTDYSIIGRVLTEGEKSILVK